MDSLPPLTVTDDEPQQPRFGLQPSARGVSDVYTTQLGATILLGNASNAASALDGEALAGHLVSRIVCVASSKNAGLLARRARGAGRPEILSSHHMDDMLKFGEDVAIASRLCDPLEALERCACEAARQDNGRRAVLVHCDMGVNRSPTLVLAFLVRSCGLSLREAYRFVLGARRGVDPLPPYREGLRRFEEQLRGSSSVMDGEHFALHYSGLLALLRATPGFADGEDSEDGGAGEVDAVFAMRDKSIEALLRETKEDM